MQDELLKNKFPVFNEFNFLLGWSKLSQDDKNKNFTKMVSHELNFFIYCKDKPYFEEIVKPFLVNKMEKSFVDYYLLDMYDKIVDYRYPQRLSQLNTLEQCMLVDALVKKGL